MIRDDTGPLDYVHQATCHQLRRAVEDIEEGDGLVANFNHDMEFNWDGVGDLNERIVTVEVSYYLPE